MKIPRVFGRESPLPVFLVFERTYPGGSEVPGARWECDDTSAPSLFMVTKFPEELTSATNQIRCRPFWNTRGNAGNFVYNLRAVAINTATSAAVPGLTFSQATDAGDLNFSYRRHIGPFTSMFSVEDESTGVACSGNTCKGKLLKIELNIDATSSLQTAGGPEYPRIRALQCNYN